MRGTGKEALLWRKRAVSDAGKENSFSFDAWGTVSFVTQDLGSPRQEKVQDQCLESSE